MWSKDIVFLLSDGYSEGAQAWLDSYHGFGQSSASHPFSPVCVASTNLFSRADLEAEPLRLTTGSIWASLGIDYPHHSFSHIGLFYGESPSIFLLLSLNSSTSRRRRSKRPPS